MARLSGFPKATFAALERIRETALIRFDSLFIPEKSLWTLQNLKRFHTMFVGRFDDGAGNFLQKWRQQLDQADDDILQLAAELLYTQQFLTSLTDPAKKLENVQSVLEWCAVRPQVPEWAVRGMERASSGTRASTSTVRSTSVGSSST